MIDNPFTPMFGGKHTARPLAQGEPFRPGDELCMREGRNVRTGCPAEPATP